MIIDFQIALNTVDKEQDGIVEFICKRAANPRYIRGTIFDHLTEAKAMPEGVEEATRNLGKNSNEIL